MMMDVKHIPICGDPTCDCCSMTLKIMEAMGDTESLKADEEMAHRCVALAKAFARTFYAHHRAAGTLDDRMLHGHQIEFFANLILDTVPALREADTVGGKQ